MTEGKVDGGGKEGVGLLFMLSIHVGSWRNSVKKQQYDNRTTTTMVVTVMVMTMTMIIIMIIIMMMAMMTSYTIFYRGEGTEW